MVKFLTFGETMGQYNAEFVGAYGDEGTYMLDCAGAESNVAVGLQKLGIPGVEAVWVSRLGDDEAGQFVFDELQQRITVKARKYSGEMTGISYLNHHEDGEHFKTYFRQGSAASRLQSADVEPFLGNADTLHVTGITPALSDSCRKAVMSALALASKQGIPISFDLNYREQLWEPRDAATAFEQMMTYADIFKLGHDEAEAIWGRGLNAEEYARHFQEVTGGLVLVTQGMSGAVACDGDNLLTHGGFRVEVIDPVGAGDAFVAGFIGGVLDRAGVKEFLSLDADERAPILERALEVANVCGALTCTRHGDTAAMPSMDEVRRFLARRDYADAATD